MTDAITLRFDYLYSDYEDGEYHNPLVPPGGAIHHDLDSHRVRLGVNYLFNPL